MGQKEKKRTDKQYVKTNYTHVTDDLAARTPRNTININHDSPGRKPTTKLIIKSDVSTQYIGIVVGRKIATFCNK